MLSLVNSEKLFTFTQKPSLRAKSQETSPIHFGALNPADELLLNMLQGMTNSSTYSPISQEEKDHLVHESINTLAERAAEDPQVYGEAYDLGKQLHRVYFAKAFNTMSLYVLNTLASVIPKLERYKEGTHVVDSEIALAPIRFVIKETKQEVDHFFDRLKQ